MMGQNYLQMLIFYIFVAPGHIKIMNCCGMYIPLSDDEHRFVQKVHPTCANSQWKHGHNSNPVATLPHAAVGLNFII